MKLVYDHDFDKAVQKGKRAFRWEEAFYMDKSMMKDGPWYATPKSAYMKTPRGLILYEFHDKKWHRIDPQPKRVSIDGGETWVSPEEAMGKPHFVGWASFVQKMDKPTLDRAIKRIQEGPDWELRVLKRYLELAQDDLIL